MLVVFQKYIYDDGHKYMLGIRITVRGPNKTFLPIFKVIFIKCTYIVGNVFDAFWGNYRYHWGILGNFPPKMVLEFLY
jgi:hypothetical protein